MDPFANFMDNFGNQGSPSGPHEPPSDLRQAAGSLFSLYTSFIEAGFTSDQAMTLIVEVTVASITDARRDEGGQA